MPDTSTRVILVRHGRTALNAEGRLRGLADPELDETGIAEAEAAAAALAPFGIVRVLSSPLRRAMRTAEIIARASGAPHLADAAFNDRDYGPWTGRLKADVVAEWGGVDAAPGVEDGRSVLARARAALDALAASPGGPVAIVTHDAVIRPLLESIRPGIVLEAPTGSWADLRHGDEGWSLASYDNRPPASREP